MFQKHAYDRSENYFEISISEEKKGLDEMSSDRDNGTKSAEVYCNIWAGKGPDWIFLKEYSDFIAISDSELSMDIET